MSAPPPRRRFRLPGVEPRGERRQRRFLDRRGRSDRHVHQLQRHALANALAGHHDVGGADDLFRPELGFGDDWKKAIEHTKQTAVEPGKQPELIRRLAVEAIETFYVLTIILAAALLAFLLLPRAAVPAAVTVLAVFQHANVRLRFPGVRWVLPTPEWHHWHHAIDDDAPLPVGCRHRCLRWSFRRAPSSVRCLPARRRSR